MQNNKPIKNDKEQNINFIKNKIFLITMLTAFLLITAIFIFIFFINK